MNPVSDDFGKLLLLRHLTRLARALRDERGARRGQDQDPEPIAAPEPAPEATEDPNQKD